MIALLGFGLVAVLLPTDAVERLELLTLDARYGLGIGRKLPGDHIVVAWIDQESMDYLRRAIPRTLVCFSDPEMSGHSRRCRNASTPLRA